MKYVTLTAFAYRTNTGLVKGRSWKLKTGNPTQLPSSFK